MIEVKIGQIWRDRDRRMLNGMRHAKVVGIIGKKARMLDCRPDGTLYTHGLGPRISLERLQKQDGWLLVKESNLVVQIENNA